VTIASTPVRMTLTPGGVQHRAPLTGENTSGVLEAAGLSKDEIADLRQRSIIA
jgi:crotonobetainyl-CoA:carnitine CoA-transferase CaiB-like acyl-CoA transferase